MRSLEFLGNGQILSWCTIPYHLQEQGMSSSCLLWKFWAT